MLPKLSFLSVGALFLTTALPAQSAGKMVSFPSGSETGSGYLSASEPLVFVGYSLKNQPKTIDVTWPDGAKTTHIFRTGVARILLQKTH